MTQYRFHVTPRKMALSLLYTFAFDTLIAVLLTALGFGKGFVINFIISQCIGLSNATVIMLGFFLARPVKRITQGVLFVLCLLAGSSAGIYLGLSLVGCDDPACRGMFFYLQLLFISVIFGIVISAFIVARDRIHQSKKVIHQERFRRLSSDKQAVAAELKMLQAQIEPHFLYNTLFNIRSLMDTDPGQARQMLDNLSGFLRLSLSCSRKENSTLDEEIRLIQAYLDIYSCRMNERMAYVIDVADDVRPMPFPPMLLQPLVENAVKHGLEPTVHGGCITIKGRLHERMICMEVIDDGAGMTETGPAGVGLSNIRERLAALYGDKARLVLEDNQPSGVKAMIEVPYG